MPNAQRSAANAGSGGTCQTRLRVHFTAFGRKRTGGHIQYRYEIDADRHLVIAAFFGDATLADAEACVAELHADPEHSPLFARVYDCRLMARMPSAAELRAVAELFRRSIDPTARVRRAIVVKPGVYYGLGRMLQSLLDLVGLELHLFTDFNEAVDWVRDRGFSDARSGVSR